jgi:hypothetical protein
MSIISSLNVEVNPAMKDFSRGKKLVFSKSIRFNNQASKKFDSKNQNKTKYSPKIGVSAFIQEAATE